MATGVDFMVALLLGIGPALALLFISLRRFDRPFVEHTLFDDRRVFFGLAVGMVVGIVSSALLVSIPTEGLLESILVVAGILLFEELFKLVYLNRRGYRERFDTTFYGVPIGVGFASTSVVATVFWTMGGTLSQALDFVLVALLSVSLGLVHAVTGALIGFGASRGDLWGGLRRALLVRYAHVAFMSPFLLSGGSTASPEILVPAVLGLGTSIAFAAVVYQYVYTVVLPGTLPEEIRRELRRERRARPVRP